MRLLSERDIALYMTGEIEGLDGLIEELGLHLGTEISGLDGRVARALGALKAGASPDLVARFLDWQDFERFCAVLLRARGFAVRENLTFRKPRAQVDILARSPSVALLVDCKQWARERGRSAMAKAAAAQVARARLVRKSQGSLEPMAVVILVLSNEQTRFADGAAIVPVHTLGDFLANLPLYAEHLSFY